MSAQRPAYTTDLTDEEWHILAALLPPEKTGGSDPPQVPDACGAQRHPICAAALAVPGACCRTICRMVFQMAYYAFRALAVSQDGTWLKDSRSAP